MSLIDFVLKRPYTVIAVVLLLCVLGVGAFLRMATDIFPEINIPVVAVVWTYNGMSADEIQNRIVALHEPARIHYTTFQVTQEKLDTKFFR